MLQTNKLIIEFYFLHFPTLFLTIPQNALIKFINDKYCNHHL